MIIEIIKVTAITKTKLTIITFIKRYSIAKGKAKVIIPAIIIPPSINKELTPLLNKINPNIIYKNKSKIAV